MQGYSGASEFFSSRREIVAEQGQHANYFCTICTQCFNSCQAAFTGADKVFNNQHRCPFFDTALNLILQAMLFGLRPHITKRQIERIGQQRAVCDAGGSNSGYRSCVGEMRARRIGKGFLEVTTYDRITQQNAVIAIDRTAQTTRPGKRIVRIDADGLRLEEIIR